MFRIKIWAQTLSKHYYYLGCGENDMQNKCLPNLFFKFTFTLEVYIIHKTTTETASVDPQSFFKCQKKGNERA